MLSFFLRRLVVHEHLAGTWPPTQTVFKIRHAFLPNVLVDEERVTNPQESLRGRRERSSLFTKSCDAF